MRWTKAVLILFILWILCEYSYSKKFRSKKQKKFPNISEIEFDEDPLPVLKRPEKPQNNSNIGSSRCTVGNSYPPDRNTIIVYEKSKYTVQLGWAYLGITCANVKPRYMNKFGSIDTAGSCVMAFREKDCTGEGTKLTRHHGISSDLSYAGISNKVGSMRLCSDIDTMTVTFCTKEYYNGKYKSMHIPLSGQCVNLKPSVGNKASSVYIWDDDGCVVLWTRKDCTGFPVRISANSGDAESFKVIGVNNKIKSVQACSAVDAGRQMYVQAIPESMGTTNHRDTVNIKDTDVITEN